MNLFITKIFNNKSIWQLEYNENIALKVMCTWQNGKKLIISVMTVFILVIYYSLHRHPYDLKLALTHHSYHRLYPYQSQHNTHQNTSSIVTTTVNTSTHNQQPLPLLDYNESSGAVILNITNIQLNLIHFQFVQLKSNKIKKCQQNHDNLQNSLLIINTNTKIIGLKYMNLIRQLVSQTQYGQSQNQGQQQKCHNFKIFLLREKHVLMMDDKLSIEEYTQQLWKTVKKLNDLTLKKFSIVTSEQGCGLLLRSFVDSITIGEFKLQLSQKIDKIILLNMYNDAILMQAPINNYLDAIKREVILSKQKLKLFNSLNLVIINPGQKQYRMLGKGYYGEQKTLTRGVIGANGEYSQTERDALDEEYERLQSPVVQIISDSYFVFQKDIHWVPAISDGIQLLERTPSSSSSSPILSTPITLQNTIILHTMELCNIHLSLEYGDYFHYLPFIQILSTYIIQNSLSSMSLKGTQYYFRYGETHGRFPLQLLADVDVNECILYNINAIQPIFWVTNNKCFKLNISTSIPYAAYLIYSDSLQFHVYTEGLNKIAPYDKQLNRSLYMFEKLQHPVIIYNPQFTKVILTIGQIFTPSNNPLTRIFTQHQILYMNQIPHKLIHQGYQNKKFIIRMCQSNNLLVFPDNFPIGKVNRQFLLEQSSTLSCYNQDNNSYQQFIDKITSNWTILRNIVILMLFKKLFIKCKTGFADLTLTFLSISLILYYTELQAYHNILIMFTVYVIDQAIKLVCQLSQHIHIERTKVFLTMTILYAVSYICQRFQFQRYNYWKMLLIFLIFFINKDNALTIGVKLYYLRDYILYWHQDMFEIVQLALFMHLTRTIKDKKYVMFNSALQVFKQSFFIGLIFFMIYSPNTDSFHSVVNFYIKCIILLGFFKVYLEYRGWKGITETQKPNNK